MEQTTPRLIYESPDGGKTVYAREFGLPDRKLISVDSDTLAMVNYLKEQNLWADILKASKTNETLRNLLEQVQITYSLIKDENTD